MFECTVYDTIAKVAKEYDATIIAVSKTKPIADIMTAYQHGIVHFGENKVQELCDKAAQLPKDICWHQIGHLQTNKVKYIAPFIHLIHSVDSIKLLETIDKEAKKINRTIAILLQIHIAQEDTKQGFSPDEILNLYNSNSYKKYNNIHIKGLMAMATFTDNKEQIAKEFSTVKSLFSTIQTNFYTDNKSFSILSMGMSDDYTVALANGSNMIRIGSILFGKR